MNAGLLFRPDSSSFELPEEESEGGGGGGEE
jgi:hypothetical protein